VCVCLMKGGDYNTKRNNIFIPSHALLMHGIHAYEQCKCDYSSSRFHIISLRNIFIQPSQYMNSLIAPTKHKPAYEIQCIPSNFMKVNTKYVIPNTVHFTQNSTATKLRIFTDPSHWLYMLYAPRCNLEREQEEPFESSFVLTTPTLI
jgi:hypothetical protein